MTEERKCFILARWAGEKTDFSAGINLPWRWCSFTLPADVHSILSLGLKSLLIVVQLHQPGVQGRMQSSPERQEEPGRAHLLQGLVLPWPQGILEPSWGFSLTAAALPRWVPQSIAPLSPQAGGWVILSDPSCGWNNEIIQKDGREKKWTERQWKTNSRTVHALLMWSIVLCFCRKAPSSAGGRFSSADPG